jgi:hypothetical protein
MSNNLFAENGLGAVKLLGVPRQELIGDRENL